MAAIDRTSEAFDSVFCKFNAMNSADKERQQTDHREYRRNAAEVRILDRKRCSQILRANLKHLKEHGQPMNRTFLLAIGVHETDKHMSDHLSCSCPT